jgi:hypothetical protein
MGEMPRWRARGSLSSVRGKRKWVHIGNPGQEHIWQWTPRLFETIRANALGPFYRGIVALTEAFLDQEAGAQDASCE